MTPAAVDFPVQSTPQQQNPSISFDSSSFADRASVSRSKPRLGKTRRRHVERANSGLNRSEPCLVDFNRVNDDVSSETGLNKPNLNMNFDSEYRETNKNDEFGKFLSGEFVFGAENSCSNLKIPESLSGLSNGFAFGTNESSLKKCRESNKNDQCAVENPHLNAEMKQSNIKFSNSNTVAKDSTKNNEFGKDLSKSFMFGARKSCSNLKKPESVSGLSTGFVLGKSEGGLENPTLNGEMKQSSMSFLNLNPQFRETNKYDEFGTFLKGGFGSCSGNGYSNLKKQESVCGLSNEFVFGSSNTCKENPKSNVEMPLNYTSFQDSNSKCEESNKKDDIGKFSSGIFASSAEKSCSNFEKPETVSGLSNEFVFGASKSGLENPSLNMEMKQKNSSFPKPNSERKESNKNDEFGKLLSRDSMFSTGKSCSNYKKTTFRRNPHKLRFGLVTERGVLDLDSNSTKEEKFENLTHETKGNAEVGFERGYGMGYVFSEFGSTLDKTSSQNNENGGKSAPLNSERVNSGAREKVDITSYDFDSSSISGFPKVFENGGETTADTESGFQKEKADDVFVFHSRRKVNSFELNGETNKVNTEDSRNNISVDNDILKSGSFVNNKQNFVFGSSFSETYAPEVSTTDNITDEMKKLSVDESKETGKINSIKDPRTNSSASSDPMFVFGSNGKLSSSYTEQSRVGSTKINGAKLQSHENTDGLDIGISNENKSRTTALGVSDEPIKLGRNFDTFEEKHATNANEGNSNDTSVGVSTPKLFKFQAGLDKSSVGFEYQVNDDRQSFFSSGLFDVKGFSIGRVEGKDNSSFMSTPVGVGSCATGFRTPFKEGSSSFSENINTGFSKSIRNRKWKKLNRKFRKVDPIQQPFSKNNEESQQKIESPEHFSPMDFSPYQNDLCASSGLARDEVEKIGADTSKGEKFIGQAHEEFSKKFWEKFASEYPFEQAETVGKSLSRGQISSNNNDSCDGVANAAFSKNLNPEETERRNHYNFPSSGKDSVGNIDFFPISKEDNVSSVIKCRNKKKYRLKVGCDPKKIDPRCQIDSSYLHMSREQNKDRNTVNSHRKVKNKVERDEEHSKQRSTAATQIACEKWKIRGNQAYEKGNSSKAEEYYTKGINSFVHNESPECSIEPLVLCYSNRAAARMLCGRMREALDDCVMAVSLDPSFLKAQLRAAKCHLALGEIEEACQYFSKCLESKGYVCLDRRIAIDAASGLQKAQKMTSCMNLCAELLRQKTSIAANSALESISAFFPTSFYSEKLIELKGEALLMLQRYGEVIQLCEETLVPAEKNFGVVAGDENSVKVDAPNSKNSTLMLWRWRLMSKCYFYQGKLELALDLLEKQEVLASSDYRSKTEELPFPCAATIRELLHHKSAGNRAFQSGKFTEAVEHYSAAVSSNIESRPFAAICFGNRAAAQQALGQISDAISDCSMAIVLDGNYSKAISRRAVLHEKIRDYASATSDLERLISILKDQSQENVEELKQARRRLSSIEEKAKKGLSLDHYLILGVKSTEEASEIKKAYRRAALRHHPDKAAQFLARGDNGDGGRFWKEICDEIRKDADRLFKTIGEAYAVLSDLDKRSDYDLQEELRNARKESNRNRDSTEYYNTPFKNQNGYYSQQSWKTYGYSRSQW